jgi:general stress protein YciG
MARLIAPEELGFEDSSNDRTPDEIPGDPEETDQQKKPEEHPSGRPEGATGEAPRPELERERIPHEAKAGEAEQKGPIPSGPSGEEGRPVARPTGRPTARAEGTAPSGEEHRGRLRGTAAMDPQTRKEVARKGGLAVSRNRQHMAEIGRKGGQSVSKNREHMAAIGRKGGAASRGHRS